MDVVYRRTQVGWAVIAPLGLVMAIAVPALVGADLLGTAAATAAGFSLLLLVFGTLTITVDRDAIEARFGIGLIKKRVELSRIRSFEPATTPWYYGWGIRLYPGGWLYNVSGLRSVELFLHDGSRYRFGTAEPEAVCAALKAHIGTPASLSNAERQAVTKSRRHWGIAIAAISATMLVGIGTLFVLEARPPVITVDADRIAIDGFVYGSEVRLADVESVTLEPALPRIETRTNGFALGTTLRGHFRVTGLGDGELYVEADAPPFVLVQHAGGFVLFNAPDPAETREHYARIDAALGARSVGPR